MRETQKTENRNKKKTKKENNQHYLHALRIRFESMSAPPDTTTNKLKLTYQAHTGSVRPPVAGVCTCTCTCSLRHTTTTTKRCRRRSLQCAVFFVVRVPCARPCFFSALRDADGVRACVRRGVGCWNATKFGSARRCGAVRWWSMSLSFAEGGGGERGAG